MFTVYILKSNKDDKRYVGFTDNLARRLYEHNSGKVKSTNYRKPLELIYTEEFDDKYDAMKREKFFKTPAGRDFLDSIGKKNFWGKVCNPATGGTNPTGTSRISSIKYVYRLYPKKQ